MAKFYHLVKLGLAAQLGPKRVVNVLLAPFLVNTSHLQVTFAVLTNPYFRPGGWDFQSLYALDFFTTF